MKAKERLPDSAPTVRLRRRAARGLFGVLCLCVLGLAAFLGSGASAAGADPACPNEAIRLEQGSTFLPECRAWEQVSPPDKNGTPVEIAPISGLTSPDGDRAWFYARGQFGDAVAAGNAGAVDYISSRTPGGWHTHAITPLTPPGLPQLFGGTQYELFSSDLTSGALEAYDLPGVADALPGVFNFYRADLLTGETQAITQPHGSSVNLPLLWPVLFGKPLDSASADLRHILFESALDFTPDATGGAPKLYEWFDGQIRIAGVLPGGSPASLGATQAPSGTTTRGNQVDLEHQPVSADGSRVFFRASPAPGVGPRLYMRTDATSTTVVSESEASSPAPKPSAANFVAASPDGKSVLFTTAEALLDSDTNTATDLYLYRDGPDPEAESNLTLLTPPGGAEEVKLLGMSNDASRVYYAVPGLVGGRQPTPSVWKLYLWDRGELRYITNLDTNTSLAEAPQPFPPSTPAEGEEKFLYDSSNWATFNSGVRSASVSGDGSILTFSSLAQQPGGEVQTGYAQLYVYHEASNSISCASCATGPGAAPSHALPHPRFNNGSFRQPCCERAMTADGRLVFFSTAAALVPGDVNGRFDAYQYDTATDKASLLSRGTTPHDSWFVTATPSGSDAFFLTDDQIGGRDRDDLTDLYDARAGGGIPEPPLPPPSCDAEACQGATPLPPSASAPGSAGLVGSAGHRKRAPRCARVVARHRKPGDRPSRKANRHARRAEPTTHKRRRCTGGSRHFHHHRGHHVHPRHANHNRGTSR